MSQLPTMESKHIHNAARFSFHNYKKLDSLSPPIKANSKRCETISKKYSTDISTAAMS